MKVFTGNFTYETEFLDFILNPESGASQDEIRAGLTRMKTEIDQRLKAMPAEKKEIEGGHILSISADFFGLYSVKLDKPLWLQYPERYYAIFYRPGCEHNFIGNHDFAIVESFAGCQFECLAFNTKEGLNYKPGDWVGFLKLPLKREKLYNDGTGT